MEFISSCSDPQRRFRTASPQLRSSGDSLLNSRSKTKMDTNEEMFSMMDSVLEGWLSGPSVSRKLNQQLAAELES